MTRNESTEIFELPNGCACCDVQGELVDALLMIVRPCTGLAWHLWLHVAALLRV